MDRFRVESEKDWFQKSVPKHVHVPSSDSFSRQESSWLEMEGEAKKGDDTAYCADF